MAGDVGDAIRIDDLRGIKIPYYDGNPSNLDDFILDWEDFAEEVVGEMRGAPRDKWVCRIFPHRLAQDLKEELRDQIREGLIRTEQACLQWLEDDLAGLVPASSLRHLRYFRRYRFHSRTGDSPRSSGSGMDHKSSSLWFGASTRSSLSWLPESGHSLFPGCSSNGQAVGERCPLTVLAVCRPRAPAPGLEAQNWPRGSQTLEDIAPRGCGWDVLGGGGGLLPRWGVPGLRHLPSPGRSSTRQAALARCPCSLGAGCARFGAGDWPPSGCSLTLSLRVVGAVGVCSGRAPLPSLRPACVETLTLCSVLLHRACSCSPLPTERGCAAWASSPATGLTVRMPLQI